MRSPIRTPKSDIGVTESRVGISHRAANQISMSIKLSFQGQSFDVQIRARNPSLVCVVDGREVTVTEAPMLSGECSFITIDGQYYQAWRATDGDSVWVHIGGRVFIVDVSNPLDSANSSAQATNEICADMPGMVVELHTETGASVDSGDAIVTIESMKMQIVLHAPRAGIIEKIHQQPDIAFDKGAVLVSLKPAVD